MVERICIWLRKCVFVNAEGFFVATNHEILCLFEFMGVCRGGRKNAAVECLDNFGKDGEGIVFCGGGCVGTFIFAWSDVCHVFTKVQ